MTLILFDRRQRFIISLKSCILFVSDDDVSLKGANGRVSSEIELGGKYLIL